MTRAHTPPPWTDDAVCAQTDPEAFFPEKGGSPRPAKAVCAVCPVREACLQYALDHHIFDGVWGGTTAQDRRRIVAARDLIATVVEAITGEAVTLS